MKYLFFISCLCHFALDANSQFLSIGNATMNGHGVYGEVYGASQGMTLNYDKVICQLFNRWNGSMRVGFGTYGKAAGRVRFISTPVGLNFFKGRHGHNKEFGVHVAYVQGRNYIKAASFLRYSEGLYFTPSIGYRFQQDRGGLLIRVQYAPFVKLKEFGDDSPYKMWSRRLTHSLGASIGYYFARKR